MPCNVNEIKIFNITRQKMEITKDNAGEILLRFRADKNITQIEISKKAGISLPTISGIENGKLKPQGMTIYKLQRYFDSLN